MPEVLEILLWCAALAAWLMVLYAIISEGLKPLSKSIQRLSDAIFRVKANRKAKS